MDKRDIPFMYVALGAIALTILSLVTLGNATPKVKSLGVIPCSEGSGISPSSEMRSFRLCDGQSKLLVQVSGAEKTGRMSRETAQEVAGLLMEEWTKAKQTKSQGAPMVLAHKGEPHTKREMRTWDAELDNAVKEGYKVFHDSSLGTNGISCDMCHPDAEDTHAHTYPKFQTQLKKVALLRDMINWCIENPMEGTKLADDDPKLKAMEMYILWAHKGEAAVPGMH